MNKALKSLSVLFLLLTMFAALCLSAIIYNTSENMSVTAYFFQPALRYRQRFGTPESLDTLDENVIRTMLLERFITEYFYVIPDITNIEQRTKKTSLLSLITSPKVFKQWNEDIVPKLKNMASKKQLRTVSLNRIEEAPNQVGYWIVDFNLKTWEKPNDFSVQPVITTKRLYIRLSFIDDFFMNKILKGQTIGQALENGMDPILKTQVMITAVDSYEEIEQGAK